MPETCWGGHAERLAEALLRTRVVTEDRWRLAVARTPRHLFVQAPSERGSRRRVASSGDRVRDSYFDEAPLLTADTAGVAIRRADPASRASVAVRGLVLLNPELMGSGRYALLDDPNGWQTALLCRVLGDSHVERVVTIAADAPQRAVIIERLSGLGYRPDVVDGAQAADMLARGGFGGLVGGGISAVPGSWITALARGGRVVARWVTRLGTWAVSLDQTGTGQPGVREVRGRMDPAPLDSEWPAQPGLEPRVWRTRATAVDPELFSSAACRAWLALQEPQLGLRRVTSDGSLWRLESIPDGWVGHVLPALPKTGGTAFDVKEQVSEHETGRTWDRIEGAVLGWVSHGRPGLDRFGLAVRSGGEHSVWADGPGLAIPAPRSAT